MKSVWPIFTFINLHDSVQGTFSLLIETPRIDFYVREDHVLISSLDITIRRTLIKISEVDLEKFENVCFNFVGQYV